MARRSSRLQPEDAPVPDLPVPLQSHMGSAPDEAPQPNLGTGVEVKTKFPVARIKRIMQADEDVGKVAQVTPIAVCMYTYPRETRETHPLYTSCSGSLTFFLSHTSQGS